MREEGSGDGLAECRRGRRDFDAIAESRSGCGKWRERGVAHGRRVTSAWHHGRAERGCKGIAVRSPERRRNARGGVEDERARKLREKPREHEGTTRLLTESK